MLSWDELGARTLARQFPSDLAADDVTGLIARVGPIQSQTARSVFLGVAARLPGVSAEQIARAYQSWALVRGSTLRGTVHTGVAEHHPALEVATRIGQRSLWNRTLRPTRVTLEQVWNGIEEFARDRWRTAGELADHLAEWLAMNDPGAERSLAGAQGRYFAFGHGGLIRRPRGGDWAGQGPAEYRSASAVLGDRAAALARPDETVDELFRRHIAANGPSSRHDLAWWSGIGLTRVDASLARLGLSGADGPDRRHYVDLPDAPQPVGLRGVRLLPEFDALMCAFEPAGRERFVDADGYRTLWRRANGLLLPPVLVDHRIGGHWRLTGTGRNRTLEVNLFPGVRRVRDDEFDRPIGALERVLGISVVARRRG